MNASLPERPNLEHLKTQAKDLLAAHKSGNADAVQRVDLYFSSSDKIGLSETQLVLAREYGFDSWAKLKAQVEAQASSTDRMAKANYLADIAMWEGKLEPVYALLAEDPGLGNVNLATACATGTVSAVRKFLDASSTQVNEKIGPKGWEPLLYVCFSSLLKDANYRPNLVATAKLLLEKGANPNANWLNPEWDNCPEPCLYGATGANDCPDLAEMLLKAGANPNDNESLYHSTELAEPTCLKLLMDYGGHVGHGNALIHLLDREEPDWVRMFLSYAKSPTDIPAIAIPFAMRRGRSAECIRVLIEAGAGIDVPLHGHNTHTSYQIATRLGRTDVVELLEAAGADTTLSPIDVVVGRLARGEALSPSEIGPEVIAALDAETPTPTIVVLAERQTNGVLEALLAAGANPNVVDNNGWTGLHHVGLQGGLETARILLRHGADPNQRDRVHNGNAIGFTCHGSANNRVASPEDYVQLVKELLDAGGTPPETAWGSPEVQAVLVQHGSKPA